MLDGNGGYRNHRNGRQANGHRAWGGPGNGRPPRPLDRRRRHARRRVARVLLLAGTIVGLGLLMGLSVTIIAALQAGTALYAAFDSELPSVSAIEQRESFKTVHIYDRHGTLLWEFWEPTGGMRTPVPLSQISQHLIDASLAAEDANFYANPGVEVRGIVRAALQNLNEQDVVSGASTITQQLVRNVLLSDQKYERSISRKLREALLAYRLTRQLPKDRILELYLNEIYYGNMAYGVEAAALTYFNKHARDLTLAEAAMIAGLPQAPSLYDPYSNPQAALERRAYVLEQMARHGFITQQQAELAKRERLTLSPHKVEMRAPHWVDYVRELLEERYGPDVVYRRGLKVFTTLDLGLQEQLEQVARNNAQNLAIRDANNTAIVALNPKTGEILAMVGSMDYWNQDIDGQVNVLLSERQPGSSIKPLVYLTAFTRGWVPSTIVQDTPQCWTNVAGTRWCPQNFDRTFRGPVTIRAALGNSMNMPAVRTLEWVGLDAVKEMARKVGITTWDDKKYLGLSLTLGGAEVKPLELAGFYATLANNGLRIPTVAIAKVVDARGEVLEEYQVPAGTQVVDPRAAYMITHILSDNNARLITFGPNSLINLPRPAAVKTGTTDNYRDTWTMGYTPSLVVGVWVGNTDGHPMKEILSSMSAGKIWREAMDTALAYLDLPPEEFPRPPGLVEVDTCGDARLRPGSRGCYREIFLAENAPRQPRVLLTPAAPSFERVSPTPTAAAATPTPRPAVELPPTPRATGTPRPQPTAAPPSPAPGPLTVPLVRGMRSNEARDQLRNQGFEVRLTDVSSPAPRGIVWDQSPPAGTTVPRGTTITLMVSRGN